MSGFRKCDNFINKCYNFEKIAAVSIAKAESKLKESLFDKKSAVCIEAVKPSQQGWFLGSSRDLKVSSFLDSLGCSLLHTGWSKVYSST